MAAYKDDNKWRVIYRYTIGKGRKSRHKNEVLQQKRSSSVGKRNYAETANKIRYDFCKFFEIYEQDKKKD